MTSIPVAISRFSANNFKCLYLKKTTHFFQFLIGNLHEIYNILKKKEEYSSLIITESIASERDVYLSVEKVLLQLTIRDSTC